MSKKLFVMIIVMCTLLCTSCSSKERYTIREYLQDLGESSGISTSAKFQDNIINLKNWGIIDESENKFSGELTYDYLAKTLCRLLESEEESVDYLKEEGWLDGSVTPDQHPGRDKAQMLIRRAVEVINNKEFASTFEAQFREGVQELNRYVCENGRLYTNQQLSEGDILYLENDGCYVKVEELSDDGYLVKDTTMEEVFENYSFSGSCDLDLSRASDYPYAQIDETSAVLGGAIITPLSFTDHNLSAKKNFSLEGYEVSYSLSSSAISVRISRKIADSSSAFFDFTISNIQLSYDYEYENGKLDNAYFKVNYDTTDELGYTSGRYLRYIADLEEVDKTSLLSRIKSIVQRDVDELQATINICRVTTPIPNVPMAYVNLDLVARIYVSGKVELLLNNSHELGFELKNGNFRVIGNTQRDVDGVIGASSKAIVGVNFNIEAGKIRLMDIEVDAGLAASVSSTLHIYDDKGRIKSEQSDLPYSAVNELSQASSDLKVCGDVSFNYVMDVLFNTSKTALYNFGFTTKKSIMNKKNQVFHNLTHIEEGAFVKSCTRKNRNVITVNNLELSYDKIVLEKYALVIKKGESNSIIPVGLPKGYSQSNLVYSISDSSVLALCGTTVKGLKGGTAKVHVATSDGLYDAEVNVLVSE